MNLRKRNFWLVLAGLGICGFLLRLIVARQLLAGDSMVLRPPASTDAATYLQLAEAYATGAKVWGKDAFYYQPFYYAVFLPVIRLLVGAEQFIPAVGVVQAALGGVSIVLIGGAFARVFGRKAGVLAAVVLMLARMHVFYTPYLLIASLQSFWMALLTYLGVAAWKRPAPWRWALAGAVCGAAIVTRGNMQLFIPLLVGLAVWRLRLDKKQAAIAVVLVVVCTQLPQLPFSIANYRATGTWSGPSTAAGAVLALGNTPEAPPGGREAGTGAGPMEYPFASTKWMQMADAEEPVSVAANIVGWIIREPLAYGELKCRMLLLYWHRLEIPNNVAIETMGRKVNAPLVHLPILADFWLIGTLGLCGLIVTVREWRKRPAVCFAALTVLLYCASIVVFYVLARFRLPMIPVLCGFAGAAAVRIVESIREKRRMKLILGAFVGSGLLVCVGFDAYRYGWESTIMGVVRPDGVVQVYDDELSVRDNGPLSFGGWTPMPASGVIQIEKRFAVSRDLCLNSPGGKSWSKRELRIRVIGDFRRTITAIVPGQDPVKQEVGRGFDDLIVPLEEQSIREEAGEVVIRLSLQCDAGVVGIVVDNQRNYQRTQINESAVEGELVSEIRCQ